MTGRPSWCFRSCLGSVCRSCLVFCSLGCAFPVWLATGRPASFFFQVLSSLSAHIAAVRAWTALTLYSVSSISFRSLFLNLDASLARVLCLGRTWPKDLFFSSSWRLGCWTLVPGSAWPFLLISLALSPNRGWLAHFGTNFTPERSGEGALAPPMKKKKWEATKGCMAPKELL